MPLFSFKNHRKPTSNPPSLATLNEGKTTAATISRESTRLLPVFGIKYVPLDPAQDEIRLLQVHQGEKTDVVSCTLWPISLAAKPCHPYETVSYCWGNRGDTATIEVNGAPVSITRSAAEVIHRLRLASEDRLIWVDAVCINQTDQEEKGKQVSIMAKIYSRASRNIVWLGHNQYSNDYLKQEVCRTILNIRQHTANFRDLYAMTHTRKQNMRTDGKLLDPEIDLDELRFLFAKPWFLRLWIVQEAALARRNVCHIGTVTLELTDILRIAVWLRFNMPCLPHGFEEHDGIGEAISLWYLVDRKYVPKDVSLDLTSNLWNLRFYLKDFKVTNAHDHMYAMLGLLVMTPQDRERHRAALVINYNKKIQHVFRDATRAFIETSGSLNALRYRSSNLSGLPAIEPSWTLDLRNQWRNEPNPAPFGYLYNADDGIQMSDQIYDAARDADVLCLKGILIDAVDKRTDCMLWDEDEQQFFTTLMQAFKLLREAVKGQSREVATVVARTLMADVDWLTERRADANELADFEHFQEYLQRHQKLPLLHHNHDMSKYDQNTQAAMRSFGCVSHACNKRRVFVTKGGLVGVGPGNLSNNDLIVILFGGKMPYALRQVGTKRYKFLGGCYVHGIMDGEAVREQKAAGKRSTRFELI